MFRFFVNFILLGAAFALAFFWIRPEWRDAASLRTEAKSFQETLDNLQKIQGIRDKLLQDYNSVDPDERQRLAKILPFSVNEGEIMVMFEDLIRSNGLFLKTISFEGESRSAVLGEQKEPFNSSLIKIEFTGSYEAFKNFLKNLEESLLIADVENISFGAGDEIKGQQGAVVYIFNIAVKTYWQP